MSSKPLVILNPHSGGGRAGAAAEELCAVLERHVGAFDVALTERPRHAVGLAEAAAIAGRPAVIAVGGDGTIHEVVNGLMLGRAAGHRPPTLGIVGQGTGGDFRKSLGLEHRLDRYCEAIASGRTRSVDVGRFAYTNDDGARAEAWFVNILSVGMGGLVDRYVARASRSLGGTVAYLGASVRALWQSEVGELACQLHRGGTVEALDLATRSLAICNGQYFGSGMHVAPMARLDDGLFDVVSMGAAPKLRFMLSSLSIYKGKHVDNPAVSVHACDRIVIELANEGIRDRFPLDVDGEPLGLLPIDVRVEPGALSVFSG
ncbi:MAG: diacylglycerol kinase family lipid kinase [Polyangiaceae bacterium]|nr:diacylglycerol kinase family lipid kinase [Polyangiaceae bacterium]